MSLVTGGCFHLFFFSSPLLLFPYVWVSQYGLSLYFLFFLGIGFVCPCSHSCTISGGIFPEHHFPSDWALIRPTGRSTFPLEWPLITQNWKASWKFVLKLNLLFSLFLLIKLWGVLHLGDFHLQPVLMYLVNLKWDEQLPYLLFMSAVSKLFLMCSKCL